MRHYRDRHKPNGNLDRARGDQALDLKAYAGKAEKLLNQLAKEVGHLYKTRCPITGRKDVDVKYFLWVKGERAKNATKNLIFSPVTFWRKMPATRHTLSSVRRVVISTKFPIRTVLVLAGAGQPW